MLRNQMRLLSMNLSICLQTNLETAFSIYFMFRYCTVKCQQPNLFVRKYDNK